MPKLWEKEHIEFLKNHIEDMTYEEIANAIGKTKSSVEHKAERMGIVKNGWKDEEIQFILDNYENMSSKEMSKHIKRTKNAIDLKINRLGIERSPYTYDKHFFDEIDTEEKAYWFGFIYADGWTQYNKETRSYELGIELQKSDFKHLKKFNKCLNGNLEVTFRIREHKETDLVKGKHETCVIRLYSTELIKSLIDKGVVPNKSLIKQFPEVEDGLLRHFIRGYFDGNGSLYFSKGKPCCVITTGSKDYAKSMFQVLNSIGFDCYYSQDKENTYKISISKKKNNTIDFLNYMYKDSTMFLDRKYYKSLKYIKEEQNCLA